MKSIAKIADEIIVVDTGSIDRTIEICETFKAKIYKYKWIDDFSGARNFGLEKCTKDYVLYINADEIISEEDAEKISSILQKEQSNIAYTFKIQDCLGKWEWGEFSKLSKNYSRSPQIRMFSRSDLIRFKGKVFETVDDFIYKSSNYSVLNSSVTIYHHLFRGDPAKNRKPLEQYYRSIASDKNEKEVTDKIFTYKFNDSDEFVNQKCAIVIASFNVLNITKRCLESIENNTSYPYKIYIVDNGSNSITLDYLRTRENIKLIELGGNFGISKARNEGIKAAMAEEDIKYICLLDNDTEVFPGWLTKLIKHLDKSSGCVMVGPITTSCTGTQSMVKNSWYGKYSSDKIVELVKGRGDEKQIETNYIGRFCQVFDKNLIYSMGFLDESFGLLGWEDHDFCKRITNAGRKLHIVKSVFVYHKGHATCSYNGMSYFALLQESAKKYHRKWNPTEKEKTGSDYSDKYNKNKSTPKEQYPFTSIIVLTWNNLAINKRFVNAIEKYTNNYELIVVDNGSTDGTIEYLESLGNRILLIKNGKNVGISKGRNIGLNHASYDYLICLDNDQIVKEGWLKALHEEMANENDFVGVEAWEVNANHMPIKRHLEKRPGIKIDYVGAGGCLMKRSVLEDIGIYDERFSPAYFEDSLTEERNVVIRNNGMIECISLKDLFNKFSNNIIEKNGKEYIDMSNSNVETLSISEKSKVNLLYGSKDQILLDRLSEKEKEAYLLKLDGMSNKNIINDFGNGACNYIISRVKNRINEINNEYMCGDWKKLNLIIRHKCHKKIYRINQKYGETRCTEDHSIIDEFGNSVKPLDFNSKFKKISVVKNDKIIDSLDLREIFDFDCNFDNIIDFSSERGRNFISVLGAIVSEGGILTKDTNKNEKTSLLITSLSRKWIERIEKCFNSVFSTNIKVKTYKVDKKVRTIRGKNFICNADEYYRISCANKNIVTLLSILCGVGCKNKKVPNFIFNLKSDLQKLFLDEIILGDGHRQKGVNYSLYYRDNNFKYSSNSVSLISGVSLLCAMLKIKYSIYRDKLKDSYSLNYVQCRNSVKYTTEKIEEKYDGYVYDLNVEDSHIFIDACGLVAVHNTDICYRAREKGYRIGWCSNNIITHLEHCTLIKGQKSFSYNQVLAHSSALFVDKVRRKSKGEIQNECRIRELPKKVTFCMCLKNRSKRARQSIESLVNESSIRRFNFIVVEDIGDDMLNLSNFRYKNHINHYIVQTGESWSRAKLLNFGIRNSTTDYVAFWDADFIYDEKFIIQLGFIMLRATGKYVFNVASYESDNCIINGNSFSKGSRYGSLWIYPTEGAKAISGFDERFVGWGREERDFFNRFMKHSPETIVLETGGEKYPEIRITHMSHGDSSRGINPDAVERNTKIRDDNMIENRCIVNDENWGKLKIIKKNNVVNAKKQEGHKMQKKLPNTIIVMGNGPSLKDVNFEMLRSYNTFGMNCAYRHWEKINWWPTYYGCFDNIVLDSHTDVLKKLIENPDIPISRYFLLKKISDSPKLSHMKFRSNDLGDFSVDINSFGYGGNTGANCCQVAACLGYKKILLVGVDGQYVNIVDGAKKVHIAGHDRLVMDKTPEKNPNYFMDDYNRKGDVYNIPKADVFMIPVWEAFAKFAKKHGIEVINCSPRSVLTCFPKSTLEKELGIKSKTVNISMKREFEKDICFLEVAEGKPSSHHMELFFDKDICDYYYVTWKNQIDGALKYCPNTTWGQTRNILADLVPKKYRYYCFIDDDVEFSCTTNRGVVQEFVNFLNHFNPSVGVPYNITRGFEGFDKKKKDAGKQWAPAGLMHSQCMAIHHSLMKYFFPLPVQFGGFWDTAAFGTLMATVPFENTNICSYKVLAKNLQSRLYEQNKKGDLAAAKMAECYRWIKSAFKHGVYWSDSVQELKKYYGARREKTQVVVSNSSVNYLQLNKLEKFFNLNHEFFSKLQK